MVICINLQKCLSFWIMYFFFFQFRKFYAQEVKRLSLNSCQVNQTMVMLIFLPRYSNCKCKLQNIGLTL